MFIASLVIAATAAAVPATANPLAPAEQGLVQCWVPNTTKKTCRVIASYRKTGPGKYDNDAKVALSPQLTVETHTPVTVSGDAVCGYVRTQEVLNGTLRKDEQIVPAADAQPVLTQLVRAVNPLDGKETCTRYQPTGAGFTAKLSVEGSYRPQNDTQVRWISPVDGYTVAP